MSFEIYFLDVGNSWSFGGRVAQFCLKPGSQSGTLPCSFVLAVTSQGIHEAFCSRLSGLTFTFFFLMVAGIYLRVIPYYSPWIPASPPFFLNKHAQSTLFTEVFIVGHYQETALTNTVSIEEVTKVQIISKRSSHSWIVVTSLCWSITCLGFILHRCTSYF